MLQPSTTLFLDKCHCSSLSTNLVDEARTVEAFTAFNGLYMEHCWTTGALDSDVTLSITECRSLHVN